MWMTSSALPPDVKHTDPPGQAHPLWHPTGQTTRHRLNRRGDRALNKALHTIARTTMRSDPTTKAYVARRRAEGKSKREIRRCLRRNCGDQARSGRGVGDRAGVPGWSVIDAGDRLRGVRFDGDLVSEGFELTDKPTFARWCSPRPGITAAHVRSPSG